MIEPARIMQFFKKLLAAKNQPFPPKGILGITYEMGVYIIYDNNLEVAHVGNTMRGQKGLCQRLNNHISGSSSFARGYLIPNKLSVRNGFSFKLLEVPSGRERALLQALAIGILCPKHIRTGEAKKS